MLRRSPMGLPRLSKRSSSLASLSPRTSTTSNFNKITKHRSPKHIQICRGDKNSCSSDFCLSFGKIFVETGSGFASIIGGFLIPPPDIAFLRLSESWPEWCWLFEFIPTPERALEFCGALFLRGYWIEFDEVMWSGALEIVLLDEATLLSRR